MKKLILLIGIVVFSSSVFGQRILKANYWTSPRMSLAVVPALAKCDLVIADVDNWVNSRESLKLLKKLNPNLLLIVYTNILEIFPKAGVNRPWQQAVVDEIYTKCTAWLLKTDKGNDAIFTQKMRMLNVSTTCPKIKGQTYTDWYASKLTTGILRDSLVDGYFGDNGSGNWSWIYTGKGEQIDANNDGKPNQDCLLDRDMSEGIHNFLRQIRQAMGKKFIILANKGSVEYMDVLNGRMFEDWRNDYLGDNYDSGWWQCFLNGRKTGNYTIIKIKSPKDLEFAYLSAKLLDHDVYIAIGQDYSNPYPEFPDDLGKLQKIEVKAYFEKGSIEINPSKSQAKISEKKP
jgi:hypothetical protein